MGTARRFVAPASAATRVVLSDTVRNRIVNFGHSLLQNRPNVTKDFARIALCDKVDTTRDRKPVIYTAEVLATKMQPRYSTLVLQPLDLYSPCTNQTCNYAVWVCSASVRTDLAL